MVGALSAHIPRRKRAGDGVGRAMDHEHAEHEASDQTSIAHCRELLGEEADGLSDHDIDRIRQHADAMARVIVEIFLDQRVEQR
jgi:hypothetical protein